MTEPHDHRDCFCAFLPPYVVRRLADSDNPTLRRLGIETIQASAVARTRRLMLPAGLQGRAPAPELGRRRSVYDMAGQESPLPGDLRRKENQQPTGVADVDQAYDHAGVTYAFYKSVLRRESIDGAGYPLKSSVNFGFEVANAFWEGTQMVYGAGDGDHFLSFARSLEITAHEMSHGVLSHSSQLAYHGQSGALNESFCDVIGISVMHHAAKTDASAGSWMVGREVVGPGLGQLAGFRSFTADRAYVDHPVLGTDPQPKHMVGYVNDPADDGGVHTNSGIPNHAFHHAAMEIGGNVWECATKIWYDAFTNALNPQATFAQAAQATERSARALFGNREGDAVAQAWAAVGV